MSRQLLHILELVLSSWFIEIVQKSMALFLAVNQSKIRTRADQIKGNTKTLIK